MCIRDRSTSNIIQILLYDKTSASIDPEVKRPKVKVRDIKCAASDKTKFLVVAKFAEDYQLLEDFVPRPTIHFNSQSP